MRRVGCGGGGHVWNNIPTSFPFHWKYNGTYEPSYLDHNNTVTSLRGARTEWELSQNWCGLGDNSSANYTYDGETTLQWDWAGGNGSTVGFGNNDLIDPTCQGLCLGLTVVRHSGGYTVEADTRLQWQSPGGFGWSNIYAGNHWDVQGTAAHETGHTLGFDHVSDPTLLMYPYATLGDYTGRELGYGDWYVNGLAY
jgi:hypothetical protein